MPGSTRARARCKNELELKLGSDFKSAKSWAARSLASSEKRAAIAPDSFWKLPADATEAVYYSPVTRRPSTAP